MKKPNVVFHNTETNEVIVREMTDAEFAIHQAEKEAEAQVIAEVEAKATAKAALLTQLGITEEQAKLLLS
jgi:hypothetical protein